MLSLRLTFLFNRIQFENYLYLCRLIIDIEHDMKKRLTIWMLCLCTLTISHAQVTLPDNMVEADCSTEVEAMDWGIVQGSSSQSLSHMYAQPFIGDIDHDGQSEIVTVGYFDSPHTSSSIVIYGSDLQLKYSFNTPQMYVYGGYPVTIADVDRGGFAEIFVHTRDGFLRCYHHDGNLLWTSNVPSTTYQSQSPNLILADVNGDSIPEVWSMQKIFNALTGVAIVTLPEAIGHSTLYVGAGGDAVMPVFADFDNDGVLELAGGNKVYKLDITNSSGTTGNTATLWKTISGSGIGDGLTSVADIDLDGFLDVVVVKNGCMYAWRPYSGAGSDPELIASCPYSANTAGSRALLTDVDNDGYPEILFTYATKITAYKYIPTSQTLQQMWLKNTSDLSGATTMTAFDFNQDGSVEIVYRDESDLRIIDGTTGNNKSAFTCIAPTAAEYPAIVDLDMNGEAEIIASSSTFDNNQDKHAKLIVFHSPANASWAPARRVWNQHAYNVVNINNDLTIPAFNFNPATTFTDPQGVVRRPFNNFLQQATTLDQYGRPFMPLANLSVTQNPVITYNDDNIQVVMTVCNTGELVFGGPMFVSIYTSSGDLIQTEEVVQGLQPGECTNITLSISTTLLATFENSYPLQVTANDNGDGAAQYGGLQAECDTTDNSIHFDGRPCQVIVPNVITPNGDGFNDAFVPQLEGDFISLEMEIYNRWGKLVYTQADTQELSWDAEGQSDGVYYCAIEFRCVVNGDKKQEIHTSVTVVR